MAANDSLEFSLQQSHSNHSNNNNNSSSNNNNNHITSYNHINHTTATNSTLLPNNTPLSCVLPPPHSLPPPRTSSLENLIIYENFDVHETHRIEDGVCTHITRLPPKKQELLKQFGIQSSSSQQSLSYYEKYIIVENFNKFCNEYQISDHRPFLDFHESGLPKFEQLKFVRFLGQGLSNLTLNKIYVGFKDLFGTSRSDKNNTTNEGYNLNALLKKKRKNLCNRLNATNNLDAV